MHSFVSSIALPPHGFLLVLSLKMLSTTAHKHIHLVSSWSCQRLAFHGRNISTTSKTRRLCQLVRRFCMYFTRRRRNQNPNGGFRPYRRTFQASKTERVCQNRGEECETPTWMAFLEIRSRLEPFLCMPVALSAATEPKQEQGPWLL